LTGCEDDFTHLICPDLQERFSYKEVQFKTSCQPIQKQLLWAADNVNETPARNTAI